MNSLQHVFASGNDGTVLCNPFPQGYQTVLGGFQSAKNVITVGGMNYNNSSKGPVKDGRLKPEIVTQGSGIVSTANNNGYSSSSGTSNATPAVSGGLALLYQQYRKQNANADPKSGLMKALLCNGASDIGNAGPDYKHGFGLMNLNRSSEMLKKEYYFISSATHNGINSHAINVPAGTGQIKVMLYWNDPSASALAAQTLVNDLDLELYTPASNIIYPGILDSSPSKVENLAVQGVDRINNIEQVVINDPAPGNYDVKIKGTSVNQNLQQEYFLVYDFIPAVPVLTFPIGGESLLPSENVLITWESPSPASVTFTIETSTDNGANWISNQSNAGVRFYNWSIPNVSSAQALVRITDNATGQQITSLPFTILGRPTVSLPAIQCEGYINLSWTAIPGATQYEVMRLKDDKMVQEYKTADASTLQYSLKGLSKDSVYWVSVRAILNGKEGRRALAISRQPNNGNCNGSLSDFDLKIDSVLSPKSGRSLTSTALTSSENIIIRIKNLDNAVATDFSVSYSLNGIPGASQQITSGLAAGGYMDISFPNVDLSALGKYTILATVINNANPDPVPQNNELTVTISHLPNNAIDLQTVFKDDVENAVSKRYIVNEIGLEGADRYDFETSHPNNGRLRTFFNSGIAFSGKNAFTLDASNYTNPAVKNYLTGTYNLSLYNAAVDDIRLDFLFKQHGQYANEGNRVWIRGDDNPATPWIEVYDLSAHQAAAGIFKRSTSLEIGDLLFANGQRITSSFQVKWGQEGVVMASDNTRGNGYTFDDIQLYKAIDDIQLLSIDEPVSIDCNLGNAAIVTVSIRNSANHAISNIPIKLKLNNEAVITENIPVLMANEKIVYHFTSAIDLSSFGNHEIISWVDFTTDNYRANDTAKLTLTNSPVISSFPHIEDFELSDGFWYTGGTNSSWAYGTPSSAKIKNAASGNKAWKTNLAGNYNDNEHSYLYSPCFDITGVDDPALSFSMAIDMEDCGTTSCDVVYVEYSTDGKTWERLGDLATGTNWYNRNYAASLVWSIENYTRWHVATVPLPAGLSNLRLRFVLKSDPGVNKEGVAIDDIHIYSNSRKIYNGVTMNAAVVQPAAGNDWVHFAENGQLVASILPSQSLGSTEVRAYINEGTVRSQFKQYYHDRNITVKSTNPVTQPVKVRMYFTDQETEDLLNASSCIDCSKPGSSYELGVTKYSDVVKSNENGSMADNNNGLWQFIKPADVKIIPFDIGYYAEFEVTEFSECWLNGGGPGKMAPVPVTLSHFIAQKQNEVDVKLEWSTEAEIELDRFEIELAKGSSDYQSNQYQLIGTVKANGSQPANYDFLDAESNKNTVRYYRLKMIAQNGFYMYSSVKSVQFGDITNWKILPNPSSGIFNLRFQVNQGEKLILHLTDALGRVLKKIEVLSTGSDQQNSIDLTENIHPAGIYFIRAGEGSQQKVFKIVKK